MLTYLTGQLISSTETNINEKVKYTANTGEGIVDEANSSIDGSGIVVLIATGASNGTLIKTLIIKSAETVTRGMIRIFLYDGTNTRLIDEINIPERVQSGKQDTFEITYELNFSLKSGYSLYASTERPEKFHIITEGLDYAYPSSLNGL